MRAITANVQSSSGQSVTVKKAETTAVIEQSGQYYHRILETISGSTEYVYYFFSNTEITFTGADFTILSGNEYVTVQNGNTLLIGSQYSLGANDVRFTFTATDGGTVYTGRIFAYLSQFGLGESLVNYQTTTASIEAPLL